MMVEAGGTEAHVGALRGRRPEGHRGGHRRGPRRVEAVDPASIDLQHELRAEYDAGARPDRRRSRTRPASTTRRRVRRGRRARRRRRPPRRWRSPTRPSATTASTRSTTACCSRSSAPPTSRGTFAGRGAGRSSARSARCRRRSCAAASSTRASASTAAAPPTSGRCRPRSASSPTAHGSGLFQRGETQVLNVATLGMPRMEQMLDTHRPRRPASATCTTTTSRRSPPARPAASARPKRREIGHGALAERALLPVVPLDGGVALHAARRLRGAGVERLHLDGARCAARRCR